MPDILGLRFNALILKETGRFPELSSIELHSELEDNQVLVRVLVTGICGKQLEEIDGTMGYDRYIPHMLGHEGCGLVIAVGRKVSNVVEGDKVVMHWITETEVGNYIQPKLIDTITGSQINCGPITTFAEYSIVLCNRVTKIPSDTDPAVAALLGCGMTTGLGAVFNEAKIEVSDKVLVVGCGGVGLSVIAGCRIAQASMITAMDISSEALTKALLAGANEIHLLTPFNNIEDIQLGIYNVVFYCISDPIMIPCIHTSIATPSRIYYVGVPSPNAKVHLMARDIHQRRSLMGSHGGLTKPSIDIPKYLEMIDNGIIDTSLLLSEPFSIFESSRAFEAAKSQKGSRIQFKMN